MKLLYAWIQNYKNIIVNQDFRISSSYHINFNVKLNKLCISKNKEYIDNFYGNNILDVTAIVGRNGVGKTTLTKCLYNICDSVKPINDTKEYYDKITERIVVYEEKDNESREQSKLIVHYLLSEDIKIENTEEIPVDFVRLNNLEGEKYMQSIKQHDMTTVYFTNSFEMNNILDNHDLGELNIENTDKSLAYTPMLSLNRAFINLRKHYGSKNGNGGFITRSIEEYAQNMTTDFKLSYATAQSYNYLIATRYLPGEIASILPIMKDFKIKITQFGQYIEEEKIRNTLNKMDVIVKLVKNNICKSIIDANKNYYWEEIYVNVICEIALFMIMQFDIIFNEEFLGLEYGKQLEVLLKKTGDNKKELLISINKLDGVNLTIIEKFIEIVNKDAEYRDLKDSIWYKQVKNFLENYEKIKEIKISDTINYGDSKLIELIIDNYSKEDTVYGRMMHIIPPPMSSGEIALINIFATVYSALKRKTSGSLLLVMDEIDAFLHPKWQQEILTYITRWINESEKFNNKKVQLVVATHSPIILSDIPRDNIIYLKEPFEVYSSEQLTFGANINTLFYDSFFMEKGSIGTIAKKEIQWAIDNSIKNMDLSFEEQKRLVYIINNIGDKFLREKLKSYPVYIESAKRVGMTYN